MHHNLTYALYISFTLSQYMADKFLKKSNTEIKKIKLDCVIKGVF